MDGGGVDGQAIADPVLDYVNAVLAGTIVAGPHVRAACRRHLRDLQHGDKRGLRWNLEKALAYIEFFETVLCLNGGEFEGRPFLLQPWQKFIVGSLFGWVWAHNNLRRFSTAYVEIGKGNGKSPLAAGVGFAGMVMDDEPRAEIYAAATKKDQAMILFRDAVAMLDQSPELLDRMAKSGVGERCWNIAYPAQHSFFRPISSDDGQSGPRPHIGLLDEVHEAKDSTTIDMMRAGVKGRRQALMFEITNSGVSRQSICFEHHEASIAAVNAEPGDAGFNDTWFSYVCSLDACTRHAKDGKTQPVHGCLKCDDWMSNPACWPKANPNLGVSIQRKYLEDQVREARNIPSKQNLIGRLNFCVWADSVSAWIGRDAWMAVEHELVLEDFTGRQCYAGIDLSSHRDLTAGALFFPDDEGGGDLFVKLWTPEQGLREREENDKVPYSQWIREGHLHTTTGGTVDYGVVAEWLREVESTFDLVECGYDRWRIQQFKKHLENEGDLVVSEKLKEFGQGYKDMTPAIDSLETMIIHQRIRIHANPVLRWNAACAVLDSPTKTEKKFAKAKVSGRIDGLVAGAIAVGSAGVGGEPGDFDGFIAAPLVLRR